MIVSLSKAYDILKKIDSTQGEKLLDHTFLDKETQNATERLREDISDFNELVKKIDMCLSTGDHNEAKKLFIIFSTIIKNIESEFSNLSDEVDGFIRQSPLFDNMEDT
ncbi:MAG: hypothetical protein HQK52_10230 [Oligoflexia bacterium]|nr:hypothetical protein [Oligoflexia bacterium]